MFLMNISSFFRRKFLSKFGMNIAIILFKPFSCNVGLRSRATYDFA